jgi:hypothetical protein
MGKVLLILIGVYKLLHSGDDIRDKIRTIMLSKKRKEKILIIVEYQSCARKTTKTIEEDSNVIIFLIIK